MATIGDKVRSATMAAFLVTLTSPFVAIGATRQTQTQTPSPPATTTTKKPAPKAKTTTPSKTTNGKSSKTTSSGKTTKGKSKAHTASRKPTAQTIRLTSAFKASEQLRPMAQQLALTRSAAAYSGVENYARTHPGEGAAAAHLALGHAYMLDHRYVDAIGSFHQANVSGTALDDYADYLGAQAAIQAGRGSDAYALLDRFADRHPESIFEANAPVLLANAHLQQNDPQGALRVLVPLADSAQASHVDFRYALGRAYQMSGDTTHAAAAYRASAMVIRAGMSAPPYSAGAPRPPQPASE